MKLKFSLQVCHFGVAVAWAVLHLRPIAVPVPDIHLGNFNQVFSNLFVCSSTYIYVTFFAYPLALIQITIPPGSGFTIKIYIELRLGNHLHRYIPVVNISYKTKPSNKEPEDIKS